MIFKKLFYLLFVVVLLNLTYVVAILTEQILSIFTGQTEVGYYFIISGFTKISLYSFLNAVSFLGLAQIIYYFYKIVKKKNADL